MNTFRMAPEVSVIAQINRGFQEDYVYPNPYNPSPPKCLDQHLPTAPERPSPSLPQAPECPVCMESLAPPAKLHQCPEGHLLCEDCRTQMTQCPICRKPLQGQGRAIVFEQYLRELHHYEDSNV